MWDILWWLVVGLFGIALLVVGGVFLRSFFKAGSAGGAWDETLAWIGSFFGPGPERRLEVVDQANVDSRRRLVLVRRDDVEHLIMTGGPVDVVIETGIGQRPARQSAEVVEAPTTVYSRPPRSLGQAAGE
jgi:flagellar protein FliO/FliZ